MIPEFKSVQPTVITAKLTSSKWEFSVNVRYTDYATNYSFPCDYELEGAGLKQKSVIEKKRQQISWPYDGQECH